MKRINIVCLITMIGMLIASSKIGATRLVQYDLTTDKMKIIKQSSSTNTLRYAVNETTLAYGDSTGTYLIDLQTGIAKLFCSDKPNSSSTYEINDKYLRSDSCVRNMESRYPQYISNSRMILGSGSSDYLTLGSLTSGGSMLGVLQNLSTKQVKNYSYYVCGANDDKYIDWKWDSSNKFRLELRDCNSDTVLQSFVVYMPNILPTRGYISDEWIIGRYHEDGKEKLIGAATNGTATWTGTLNNYNEEFDLYNHTAAAILDVNQKHTVVTWDLTTNTRKTLFSCENQYDPITKQTNNLWIEQLQLTNDYAYWVDNCPEPCSLYILIAFSGVFILRQRIMSRRSS